MKKEPKTIEQFLSGRYTLLFFDQFEEGQLKQKPVADKMTGARLVKNGGFPAAGDNEPEIFRGDEEGLVTFCIKDLFMDLFVGGKTTKVKENGEIKVQKKEKPAFVKTDKASASMTDRQITEFFLGDKLYNKLNEESEFSDTDLKNFLIASVNETPVTRRLYRMFSSNKRGFVKALQNHFRKLLKDADYSDPDLPLYLNAVCTIMIVPPEISPKAHHECMKLLSSQKHDDLSVLIANIFLCAILGLYPIRYGKRKNDRENKVFRKTYMLNSLGMEYIWLPEESAGRYYFQLQNAWNYFRAKRIPEALHTLKDIRSAQDIAVFPNVLAESYYLTGMILNLYPKEAEAEYLPREAAEILDSADGRSEEIRRTEAENYCFIRFLDSSDESQEELRREAAYEMYQNYKTLDDPDKALQYLKQSYDAGYARAVIEVTNSFLKNEKTVKGAGDASLNKKLTKIIENLSQYSDADAGECLYLRSLIGRRTGENEKADADLEAAAARGHDKARQEISRKERNERNRVPSFIDSDDLPACFANTLTGYNLLTVSTFSDHAWSLSTADSLIPSNLHTVTTCDIDSFIKHKHLDDGSFTGQRYIFLFMSEEEDRNINDTLALLDKLFNIALRIPEDRKKALIKAVDIYTAADYERASVLIDANLSDMGKEIYFKVHVMDEQRDAAHQLLCCAPLFLPAINTVVKEKEFNVVLFGSTETNYRLIKESIAAAYMGTEYPVTITLFGSEAQKYERHLMQECPGLYSEPILRCIRPLFIPCEIRETNFPDLLYGSTHDHDPEDQTVSVLNKANYFVIDLEDHYDSIRFAMELRTWLLRSRGTFDRAPFIAVKSATRQNAYLTNRLTLSGQSAGNTYFNKYDIFPFGVPADMYSYHDLIEDPVLEKIALRVHQSYYGPYIEAAENDYYSYSYNADSSLSTATGLVYRMFAAGVYFKRKEDYRHFGALTSKELSGQFKEAAESLIEQLGELEQSRWNGFMLSRGWESAGLAKVLAYKDQSTGSSHKHTLAKLHPFIREWEELETEEMRKILGVLKSRFDYDKSPRAVTRKSVKDTCSFLEEPEKE